MSVITRLAPATPQTVAASTQKPPRITASHAHSTLNASWRAPYKQTRLNQTMNNIFEPAGMILDVPSEWQVLVRPDGRLYYRHKEKSLVTDTNVSDVQLSLAVEKAWNYLEETKRDKLREQNTLSPDELRNWEGINIEFYIGASPIPDPNGQIIECQYYLVDHANQEIFWLHDVEWSAIWPAGIVEGSHDRKLNNYVLYLRQNYFQHLEYFPCHITLPTRTIQELRWILTFMCNDYITSDPENTTSPWTMDDAKNLLDVLQLIDETGSIYQPTAQPNAQPADECYKGKATYQTWYVSRLFALILSGQIIHQYALPDAITDRLFIGGDTRATRGRRLSEFLAGGLTMGAHRALQKRLEVVWADRIISTTGWRNFMEINLSDWADTNLMATVALSANMAFLALDELPQSATTVSIISAFFSLTSIVIGLHHIRKHREQRRAAAEIGSQYFFNMSSSSTKPNLLPLSVFLSLPLAFFSWSLVSFAAALGIYAFKAPLGKIAFGFIGTVLAGLLICVGGVVTFFWGAFREQK